MSESEKDTSTSSKEPTVSGAATTEVVEEPRAVESAEESSAKQSEDSSKKSLGNRIKKVIAVLIGIVFCVVVIGSSIAGYLNVSVISSSGQFTGQDAELALYEGDVVAALVDDDPSNDPEPKTVNHIVVGQRSTFNGMGFGEHTLMLTLDDEQAASQVSIEPETVTMWGIDMRITYEIS